MSDAKVNPNEVVIQVYLDDGRVYSYPVTGATPAAAGAKAREHATAIVRDGYRTVEQGSFEFYPAHRILKVKAVGAAITAFHTDAVDGRP